MTAPACTGVCTEDLARRLDALEAKIAKLERRGIVEARGGIREVAQLVGRDASTIGKWLRDPASTFPRPVRPGGPGSRRVWLISEVKAWIAEQAAAPRAPKLRGVAAWTREQHAEREARQRAKRAAAASGGGHA